MNDVLRYFWRAFVKNRASLFPFTAVLFLMALLIGKLQADENKVPAWKKALPGTHAFLGDDGGQTNTATVCDTADRYRDWLKMESAPGCQAFQHGLEIVIEVVLLDPVKDTTGSTWLPLAKINIPSRNFTGYTQLLGLHPKVPTGTRIHFTSTQGDSERLYKTADMDEKDSLDLGPEVSATVLSYDPTDEDKLALYVSINEGPHKGQKGWMLSFLEKTDDGEIMNQFEKAVIENKQSW
jgi:hypothetical protein